MSDAIKVVCRFRPIISLEQGQKQITDQIDNTQVKVGSNLMVKTFNFDHVFSPEIQQPGVFEKVSPDLLTNFFEGYNCTLFAYGQSGSGKTYTLQGDLSAPEQFGLIPRIIKQIYTQIQNQDKRSYKIQISFLECYMEKVKDLIKLNRSDLQIKENKEKGVYIENLAQVNCDKYEEAMKVYLTGISNRTVGATKLNLESSRSHSLLLVQSDSENADGTDRRCAKFWMIDLAGSEKLSKTEAEGLRMEEAKNINTSLTTLGMVIMKLSTAKASHVPYRDSKLTRLLQESLGGNAKTVLCICCSPAQVNFDETISTLNFGTRAKMIKNKAKINKQLTVQELLRMLELAKQEIAALKLIIKNSKGGIQNEGENDLESGVESILAMKEQINQLNTINQEQLQQIQDFQIEIKSYSEIIEQFNIEKQNIDGYKEEVEDYKHQIEMLKQLSGAQITSLYQNENHDSGQEYSTTDISEAVDLTPAQEAVQQQNNQICLEENVEQIGNNTQVFQNLLNNVYSQLNQNVNQDKRHHIAEQFVEDFQKYQSMISVDAEQQCEPSGEDKIIQVENKTPFSKLKVQFQQLQQVQQQLLLQENENEEANAVYSNNGQQIQLQFINQIYYQSLCNSDFQIDYQQQYDVLDIDNYLQLIQKNNEKESETTNQTFDNQQQTEPVLEIVKIVYKQIDENNVQVEVVKLIEQKTDAQMQNQHIEICQQSSCTQTVNNELNDSTVQTEYIDCKVNTETQHDEQLLQINDEIQAVQQNSQENNTQAVNSDNQQSQHFNTSKANQHLIQQNLDSNQLAQPSSNTLDIHTTTQQLQNNTLSKQFDFSTVHYQQLLTTQSIMETQSQTNTTFADLTKECWDADTQTLFVEKISIRKQKHYFSTTLNYRLMIIATLHTNKHKPIRSYFKSARLFKLKCFLIRKLYKQFKVVLISGIIFHNMIYWFVMIVKFKQKCSKKINQPKLIPQLILLSKHNIKLYRIMQKHKPKVNLQIQKLIITKLESL